MKRALVVFLLGLGMVGVAFGGSHITLKAPQVISWTQFVNGSTRTASQGEIDALNSALNTQFSTIENQLNTDFFSNLNDLKKLSRGFANANMAAFDNASLLGYQTYDLFAVMLGFDLGLAVPSLNPSSAASAVNDIVKDGDVYAGLATGGFAGQVGINLSFLVPDLYGSAKIGFVPSTTISGVTYQQGMFGLGVNYTLVKQYDFFYGFVKWRGVSVGSGFTFNGNSVNVNAPVPDQSQSFTTQIGGQSVNVQATTKDTTAKLNVTSSSFVIPIDVMTSIQALWFLNFGLGLGVDLNFASAQIKVGGDSQLDIGGISGAKINPGSANLTAADTTGGGDFFVPRVAASVGLDIGVFKLDMPVNYYPLSTAFSIGFSGGIVW